MSEIEKQQIKLKVRVFLILDVISFTDLPNSMFSALYFWGQSITVFSLFLFMSTALGSVGASFRVIYQIYSPFFYYNSTIYASINSTYSASLVISLLLAIFLMAFAALFYMLLSKPHPEKDQQKKLNGVIQEVLRVMSYLLVTGCLGIAGFLGKLAADGIQNSRFEYVGVAIFDFVAVTGLVFALQEYSCCLKFSRRSTLSRLPSNKHSFLIVIKMVLNAIIAALTTVSNTFLIAMLILLIIVGVFELRKAIFQKRYLGLVATRMSCAQSAMVVTFEIMALLCLISQSALIIHNYVVTCSIVVLLFILAIERFQRFRYKAMTQQKPSQVQSEAAAVIYMFELVQLLQDDVDRQQQVIMVSLIQIHSRECMNLECFCHKFLVVNSKELSDKQFRIKFVEQKLHSLQKIYHHSVLITLIFAAYKLEFVSAYAKTSHFVDKILNKAKTLDSNEQFLAHQLKIKIKHFITKNNKGNTVCIEKFFQDDELRKHLRLTLSKINSQIIQKYRKLSFDFCNLNVIESFQREISASIRKIEKIRLRVDKDSTENMKIYELLLIYSDAVIGSKEDFQKIVKTISKKFESMKHLKGLRKENLNKLVYTENGCVFQSIITAERIGFITNASVSCQNVLKVPKEAVVGRDIHDFFPQFLVASHRKVLNDWMERDNYRSADKFDKVREVFFVNSLNQSFEGIIYIKMHLAIEGLKIYVLLVKNTEQNCLILSAKLQLEGYGAKLNQIFDHSSIKKSISQFVDKGFTEFLRTNESGAVRVNFRGEGNSRGAPRDRRSTRGVILIHKEKNPTTKLLIKDRPNFVCDLTVKKTCIRGTQYYAICFKNINRQLVSERGKNISRQRKVSIDSFEQAVISQFTRQEPPPTDGHLEETTSSLALTGQEDSFEEEEKGVQPHLKERDNPSIIDDSTNNDSSVNFMRLMSEVKQRAINSNSNSHVSHRRTTLGIIIVCLLIMLTMVGQYELYRSGLSSFNDVIFADGAVSDNNQLLEIIYNQVLASRSYCHGQNMSRCDYLLRSANFICNVVFQLFEADLRVHNDNVTFLSGLRFYEYYEKVVPIVLNGTTLQVSVEMFNQYFFYAIKSIGLVTNTTRNYVQIEHLFDFVFTNWGTMKFVNHNAISYYQVAGLFELSILSAYIYISAAVFLVLNLVLGFIVKSYYDKCEQQRSRIALACNEIPLECCNVEQRYYEAVKEMIGVELYTPLRREKLQFGSKRRTRQEFDRQTSHNYVIVGLLFVLLIVQGASLVSMLNLFSPATNDIILINGMMDSENYLLENYFQLKTYYLAYNFSKPPAQIQAEILQHLNQSEIAFNKYAKQSISVFAASDPLFSPSFTAILIQNVCNITAYLFQDWQVEKCNNQMNFQILQKGLIASMTFFQRQTYQALIELRLNTSRNATEYFMQKAFQDIDDYIIYMFRLYQATQAELVSGLNLSMNAAVSVCLKMIITQSVLLFFLLLAWYARKGRQELKLSDLYFAVLQFPKSIFKEKKELVLMVEEVLEMN